MKRKDTGSGDRSASNMTPRWVLWQLMGESERRANWESGCWRLFGPGHRSTLQNTVGPAVRKKNRKWTEREDAYIQQWYMTQGRIRIAKVLKRDPAAIGKRAQQLGLRVRKVRAWDVKETEYLRCHYFEEKSAKIARHLGRTVQSIMQRAKILGIRKFVRRKTSAKKALAMEQRMSASEREKPREKLKSL